MADTNQTEDDVLRRMLATKPTPHKPKDKPNEQGKGVDKARLSRDNAGG